MFFIKYDLDLVIFIVKILIIIVYFLYILLVIKFVWVLTNVIDIDFRFIICLVWLLVVFVLDEGVNFLIVCDKFLINFFY